MLLSYFLTVIFMSLAVIFFLSSTSLLKSLLILEMMTFIILSVMLYSTSNTLHSDLLALIMFSVFVLESVIGLAGLISVVYFTGKDYLSLKIILN